MEKRLVELTHKHKLSHLGSCLTALPILKHIYSTKNSDDIVVLSAGHAGLALYVVLEAFEGHDAEDLLERHGIHPCKDIEHGIHVSTGSLGSGILVAVGYALGDRTRDVYCVLSDGECAEGSVWEALACVQRLNLTNLKVHVNINGYSAYDAVNTKRLKKQLRSFCESVVLWDTKPPNVSFLHGLQGHYHVMKDEHKDELLHVLHEETVCSASPYCNGAKPANFFDYGRLGLWYLGRYTSRLSRALCKYWSGGTASHRCRRWTR